MLRPHISLFLFLWAVHLGNAQDECVCYQELASGLQNPLLLVSPPDGSNRAFVGEQTGFIYIYDSEWNRSPEPFLNISDIVVVNPGYDERGLLSLAFHPNFAENGKVFVYFNTESDTGSQITRLSQFFLDENNPDVVDYGSEIIILDLEQPFENHNGATLMFGIDNLLYITLGDGGAGGDPFGNAQNKGVLLGKILRINVDNVTADNPYTIPDDNPFVDEEGSRGEIYAYGFRNPWRCDVDEGDPDSGENRGRMFCADVGQDAWEEVDILEIGGNFGWNAREGFECFDPDLCGNIGPEVLPIHAYSHDLGSFISITGGVIYRGCINPHLNGFYIFADLSLSVVWQLVENTDTGEWPQSDLNVCAADQCTADGFGTTLGRYILSFGEDQQGEVYVLTTNSLNPFETSGVVYRIVDPNSNAVC